MSVSLRPVYRAGKAPARPPLALVLAAFIAALALTGFDVAYQFSVGRCDAAVPVARMAVPATARPAAPVAAPRSAPRARVAEMRATPAPAATPRVTPAS